MKIVITGADGFLGRNLRVRLRELGYTSVTPIVRSTSRRDLECALLEAGFVFHLAGVNRPRSEDEFAEGNTDFTALICDVLTRTGRLVPFAFSSSTQAVLDNAYGRSKHAAEQHVLRYGESVGAPVYVFRLTNVFGKWSKPFYNSAVATFCHQIARRQPVTVNDAAAPLLLVYVDDVVQSLVRLLDSRPENIQTGQCVAGPVYETTVGAVVQLLEEFARSRESLITSRVGIGFERALYSTYISFLPPSEFVYEVPSYQDQRGVFVEMLKTPDCGQFSFFTAFPGVTRGEHYHHTKTEKFLVIKGAAHFGFRNIDSGEKHEVIVRGGEAKIVETTPGWTHNITNVGDDELVVMLWASEIFDRARPDTIALKVEQ